MIVRLMGEGQYRVEEGVVEQLNALDDLAGKALEAGDEPELDRRLEQMFDLVRTEGDRLADDDLSPSDAVVPPSDLTLEETRQLMTADGFIPDIPGE